MTKTKFVHAGGAFGGFIDGSMSTDRRQVLKGAAATAGLTLIDGPGGGLANAATGDEHFFLFVELRGGIMWHIATDARHPDKVKALPEEQRYFHDVKAPLTNDQFVALAGPRAKDDQGPGSQDSPWMEENAERMIVPFDSRETGARWEDAYLPGVTSQGTPYCLGWSAFALREFVDRIAVIRGVRSLGFFHGANNSGDEIFSGNVVGQAHVATVLAKLLSADQGTKLLDNLALENPLVPMAAGVDTLTPIHATGRTLGLLAKNLTDADRLSGPAQERFTRFATLADAILRDTRTQWRADRRALFSAYKNLFSTAPALQKALLGMSDLGERDISLDLKAQANLALSLFKAGLTRVMTICVGAPNGINDVDAAGGQFDCHQQAFSASQFDFDKNTADHPRQVREKINDIAWLIRELEQQEYRGKKLIDQVTVVISSEFSRYQNFSGNEYFVSSGAKGSDPAPVGNGHNWLNNNYIMFGKGVRTGVWLGETTVASQIRHDVDFAKLGATKLTDLHKPEAGVFKAPKNKPGTGADPEGEPRGFAARDVVKTIMAVAGKDARYASFYGHNLGGDAEVIGPVVKR